MRTTIIIFTLLTLVSCSRTLLDIECFDKSGKLILKKSAPSFSAQGLREGEKSDAHKCVITETNKR